MKYMMVLAVILLVALAGCDAEAEIMPTTLSREEVQTTVREAHAKKQDAAAALDQKLAGNRYRVIVLQLVEVQAGSEGAALVLCPTYEETFRVHADLRGSETTKAQFMKPGQYLNIEGNYQRSHASGEYISIYFTDCVTR